MAPISVVSPSMECLKEIQEECFKVGIPLKTRHREVAPNQYEVVALFGHVTTHVDQNIILSQIIEEIAVKHDLAALLHEKPFQGVNGSGKHNNWSLRTKDGVNILDHRQVFARTGRVEAYPLVMAAILKRWISTQTSFDWPARRQETTSDWEPARRLPPSFRCIWAKSSRHICSSSGVSYPFFFSVSCLSVL